MAIPAVTESFCAGKCTAVRNKPGKTVLVALLAAAVIALVATTFAPGTRGAMQGMWQKVGQAFKQQHPAVIAAEAVVGLAVLYAGYKLCRTGNDQVKPDCNTEEAAG